MTERIVFTLKERNEMMQLYQWLKEQIGSSLEEGDEQKIRHHISELMIGEGLQRDVFNLNPMLLGFQTARLMVEETGLKRDSVLAILLRYSVDCGQLTLDDVERDFGESVCRILHGLRRKS